MIPGFDYIDTLEEEEALVVWHDFNKVRMNSSMYPAHEAYRWALQFDAETVRTYCVFGIGTGIFVEKMVERIHPDSIVIACDPITEVAMRGLQRFKDENKSFQNLFFCCGDNWNEELMILLEKKVPAELVLGLQTVILPQEEKVFPEDIVQFMRTVIAFGNKTGGNLCTTSEFQVERAINPFKNRFLYKNAYFAADLTRVIPSDVPIIIVAAGPSLDKNIEELNRAKGHAFIIAVDTALNALMARDIMPDLTISVDPKKNPDNYSDDRCNDIAGVFSSTANPEITSGLRGDVFIYDFDGYLGSVLTSLEVKLPHSFKGGGSVATVAFVVAFLCRGNDIILVGQDLAYAGEYTHVGSVISAGIRDEDGQEYVEGIDGHPIRTRSDWKDYLEWFETSIVSMRKMGDSRRIIDATEGGARISGTEVMTLKEVVDTLCSADFDFGSEMSKISPSINIDIYSRLIDKMSEAPQNLENISAKAGWAIEACERLLSGKGTKRDGEILETAKGEIENMTEYSILHDYIMFSIVNEMSRLRLLGGDAREQTLNLVRSYKLFFETIAKACPELAIMIKEVLDDQTGIDRRNSACH